MGNTFVNTNEHFHTENNINENDTLGYVISTIYEDYSQIAQLGTKDGL